jgi:hypothetical protein
MTIAILMFGGGVCLGAALAAVAGVLWLRRTLARTRVDILQSAALEVRALSARIAVLETSGRSTKSEV